MSPDRHLFSLFGRHFLLDVPTGALMSLDEEAFRVFAGLKEPSPDLAAEIATLRARGLLLPDPMRLTPPPPSPRRPKA
ncbi:MAG: hypothetical protein GX493_12150, partial [Firmicutes bacterium]|nr:hypothetical protein [Bacillota bacterium]